ncbi:MAG TPA: glycosyltransferase [Candidatus Tectomicrobia bacterium]|nr:glycosyltransferase [Candidatus Tectomicrobia bacterium]
MSLRIALLSLHTCPLAALGGKETGGMNVYVRELARELSRMGVEADVFTRSQDPSIPRVVALAARARVVHVAAGPEAPVPRERVRDHVDEFVDGVDAWRRRDGGAYDLIHAHYWLSGLAGLALRARWGASLVQMFHTLGRLKNAAGRLDDREPVVRVRDEERIVAEADRVIAATAVERAHLATHYGADLERVAVVPCGVDTDLFAPGDRDAARSALGLDAGPLALYVGRLTPIKGLETLLDALARLPRAAGLLVVGGDVDEPVDGHVQALRARVARLGLAERVRFVGPQPQPALRDWYRAADVVVLPSYYESFGMVAMEAMACGRPVIASRVGGLQTTVLDEVTGVLVPDQDPVALAAAVGRLLGDPGLRRRLGREGVRWAARHRWPCVAEAVCREYASLVGSTAVHVTGGRCSD